MDRLCPDAPAPVLAVTEEVARPGGAGLAAALVAGRGVPVRLVTALESDEAGERLRGAARRRADAGHRAGDRRHRRQVPLAHRRALAAADRPRGRPPGRRLRRGDRRRPGRRARRVPARCSCRTTAAGSRRTRWCAPRSPGPWPAGCRWCGTRTRAARSRSPGVTVVTPNLAEARGAAGDRRRRLRGGRGARPGRGPRRPLGRPRRRRHPRRPRCGGAAPPRRLRGRPGSRRGRDRPVRRRRPLRRRGRRPARRRRDRRRGGGRRGRRRRGVRGARRGSGGAAGRRRLVPARRPCAGPGWCRSPTSTRARALVARVRSDGGTVVATGGVFDPLHRGHAESLAAARALGDCLLVLVNSDASVRRRTGAVGAARGPGRGAGRAGRRRRGRPVRGRRPARGPRRPAPRPVGEGRRPRPGRPPGDPTGALVGRRGRRRAVPDDRRHGAVPA